MTEPNERARYIESLRLERAGIAQRPDSARRTARLAELDRVLDGFNEKPAEPVSEAAVPEGKPAPRRGTRKS